MSFDLAVKQSFQIAAAPSAPGPGSKALAQLAGPFRFFDTNEIDDFPSGNVKAEADWIVGFHENADWDGDWGSKSDCQKFKLSGGLLVR